MTAVDFAAFVDELATRFGRDHPAVFPHGARRREQEARRLRSGHRRRPRGRGRHARPHPHEAFPSHGILGEEYGGERTDAEYVWVLDPIDGTKSFIAGMPAWGTLIGLMRFGEPVFGMMHQPFTRERFFGDGGAARYRGPAGNRELRVRECAALSDALLFTTSRRC